LLGLWAFQLVDPLIDPRLQWLPTIFGGVLSREAEVEKIIVREYTSVAFVALTVYELVRYRQEFRLFRTFGEVWRTYIRRPPVPSG
jgi:hypothetical protein